MTAPTPASRRTALVTGASGGIGEALARLLAERGHDLILVARTEDRLRALADDLASRHAVRAHALPADLADPAAPQAIADRLAADGLTVDLLVNNAGFAAYGPVADLRADEQLRLLQVNVVALTHLTRLLLPPMLARRRGGILNVASTAAFMPGPLMAVYYASKAYVLSFSEALHEEVRRSGVVVTALCPGPTATGFQARARMQSSRLVRGRTLPDPADVARAGLDALEHGRPLVIPGRVNQLTALLPRLLPRRLLPPIIRRAQARADH